MKKTISLLFVLLMMLSSCGSDVGSEVESGSDSESTSNSVSSDDSEESDSDMPVESDSEVVVQNTEDESANTSDLFGMAEINSAVGKIPGMEILIERDGGIFAQKEYGLEMGWLEANKISNLERGTSVVNQSEYDYYFLMVPKYVGSKVEVLNLYYESDFGYLIESVIYENKDTPDDYGLIITSDEAETIVNYAVRVTYGLYDAVYFFQMDGKGDRPAVRVWPKEDFDDTLVERIEKKDNGLTVRYAEPKSWEYSEASGQSHINVQRDNGYSFEFQMWVEAEQMDMSQFSHDIEDIHNAHNFEKDGYEVFMSEFSLFSITTDYDSPTRYVMKFWRDGYSFTVNAYCIYDSDHADKILPITSEDIFRHFDGIINSLEVVK